MASGLLQGLLWFSIGIAVIFLSSKYSMGTLSEPGPGVLPFGLGLIFILLSTILLIRSIGAKRVPPEKRLPFGPRYHKVFLIISFLVLITFLMESLGYLLSIFLLITVAMLTMEPKRVVSAFLLGAISSLSSYILFDVWLKVPLPKGLFYF